MVNEKKIVLLLFFMVIGVLMYVVLYFRLIGLEMLEVFIIGLFFFIVLIWIFWFEVKGIEIYMKWFKVFLVILILLFIICIVMKIFISNEIDFGELGGMFFLLVFCMIVFWRVVMLYKYKKLKKILIN